MTKLYKHHILIVCPFVSPNIGGVESHIDKLLVEYFNNNIHASVITYQPLTVNIKAKYVEHGEGFIIYRVPWFANGLFTKIESIFPISFAYLFPGIFIATLLYMLRFHKKVECIHAHGLAAACAVRLVNYLFYKRIVISTHAIYSFERHKITAGLIKLILSGFDKILAVSEVSKIELIKLGLDPRKVTVHKNWINTGKFKPVFTSPTQQYKERKINLLYVGRLIEKKGVRLLLELSQISPDAIIHIVGAGPLESEIKTLLKTTPNLKFHGALRHSSEEDFLKLLRLYSSASYLISPYLYDEGYSSTLIEALACGTPVIVTKRGSPPTFLSDKVSIFLSTCPNAKELRQLVENLMKNPPTSSDLSIKRKECREFALKSFSPKNAGVIIESYGL